MNPKKEISNNTAVLAAILCPLFLALFLIPGFALYTFFVEGRQMQKWVEKPATIVSSELHYSERDIDIIVTRLKAEYSYTYEGEKYIGDRVYILPVADNFSSYHENNMRLLSEHKNTTEPFPCFVNPKDPKKSILFPHPALYQVGIATIFAMVFLTIGYGTFIPIDYLLKNIFKVNHSLMGLYQFIIYHISLTFFYILMSIPITYFTYIYLKEGLVSLNSALWFIIPAFLVFSYVLALFNRSLAKA